MSDVKEMPSGLTALDWLDRLYALTLKELKSFFYSPIAWIATTVYLFINGCLFFALVEFYSQQADLPVAGSSHLFRYSLIMLTFICPALTMHLMASEWDKNTLEGLLTAPVTETQVVLSKFLGVFLFYMGMLATMGIYLLVLGTYGNWEAGPIASSFLGLGLIGGLFLSFGLLASSMTSSQLVAYLVTFLFNLSMTWGVNLLDRFIEDVTIRDMAAHIMIEKHFGELTRGIVRTAPMSFYLTSIVLFLFLAIRSIESRKWR
jgi:ABC-2 type transport system permease protein